MCACIFFPTEPTLVDDEAVFRQILASDAATVSPKEEQHLGLSLPNGLHPWLVAQIQRCNLTGHSVRQSQTHSHQSVSELPIKAVASISLIFTMPNMTEIYFSLV